jgi:opacity protein-like surface antigen
VVQQDRSVVVVESSYDEYGEPEDQSSASINVHLSSMSLGQTALSFDNIESTSLLGVGAGLRFDIDENWMIEVGLDLLASEREGVEQVSVPLTVSAIAHLFPNNVVDPYAIAGLGLMFTEYDDPQYDTVEQYSQFLGHIGGGIEINADPIVITSDIRFQMLQARPDRPSIFDNAFEEEALASGPSYESQTVDAMNSGIQLNLGLGWRF